MSGGARSAMVMAVAATLILPRVPLVNVLVRPLLLLSTLVHELGHGFTAMLLGHQFRSFVLYADGSGVAVWAGNPGALGRAAIAAGGLVGPAVVAAVCFGVARSPSLSRAALALASVLLLAALVGVVRNMFGFGYVAVVAAALGAAAWALPAEGARHLVAFLGVQLALTVFSRSDYLFTSVARTGAGVHPSDTAQMAAALWLPAWLWGALVGLGSVAVLIVGLYAALWAPEPAAPR